MQFNKAQKKILDSSNDLALIQSLVCKNGVMKDLYTSSSPFQPSINAEMSFTTTFAAAQFGSDVLPPCDSRIDDHAAIAAAKVAEDAVIADRDACSRELAELQKLVYKKVCELSVADKAVEKARSATHAATQKHIRCEYIKWLREREMMMTIPKKCTAHNIF